MKKIYENINDLKKVLKKKKIVLCHGVFDLFHIGHLNHFKEAKSYGGTLVVSLTTDKFIKKGPNRPVFNILQRANLISSIDIVDFVLISDEPYPDKIIRILKPNYYVKGADYKNLLSDKTGKIFKEKKLVENNQGKIIFTKSELESSSKILYNHDLIFPEKTKPFFKKFASKNSMRLIDDILKKIKKLKVLIIGETIIDEYAFCETIGKSGKDPILVLEQNFKNMFIGGAASVAQNASNLCDNITFVSEVGNEKNIKKNISNKLKKIKNRCSISKTKRTIIKKRYVDEIANRKVLGVYNVNKYTSDTEKVLANLYDLKKYDLIVISDYGHGLINEKVIKKLLQYKKKLFVNCQINSNNKGDHAIQKYKNIDRLIINENELRYEMRDSKTQTKNLVKKFSNKYKISNVILTMGSDGSLLYDNKKKTFFMVPAISNKVIDKVGTGDVMLIAIALFLAASKNYEISLLAGAMSATKVLEKYGNENILNSAEFYKFFSSFLK
jgi:rfaE bifunctional protein kinase chain/domain/rfaE bifunctional protein nucleotidyltransferase chain/domain